MGVREQKGMGDNGSQNGPGLSRQLIEVMGNLCEAAPLPWAILMTGSKILHPRRGMSFVIWAFVFRPTRAACEEGKGVVSQLRP